LNDTAIGEVDDSVSHFPNGSIMSDEHGRGADRPTRALKSLQNDYSGFAIQSSGGLVA
jgi:hypothetical protein